MTVHLQGTWPGPVILRRGWCRATARPWNDDVPEAYLRVDRGGAGFLAGCATALLSIPGVAGILSPPLLSASRPAWEQAGFLLRERLALLRRELPAPGVPAHPVTLGDEDSLGEALQVDRAAFAGFWRLNLAGLQEALTATPHRALHLCRSPGGTLAGFAITGVGTSLSYLQRLAVDPPHQSQGIGYSLLRAAAAWAHARGASALLLNTPADNHAAAGFYRVSGFQPVGGELAVLGRRS